MKTFNIGLASAVALVLITAAQAQEQDHSGMPSTVDAAAEQQIQGEGALIVPAETDKIAEQFKQLDANADGHLSAEEAGKVEAIVAEIFGSLDTDADALLSIEEFRKYGAEKAE